MQVVVQGAALATGTSGEAVFSGSSSTMNHNRVLGERFAANMGACGIEDTCVARESWDPVSRAIESALRGLPLSAIAPFRAVVSARPAAAAEIGEHTT